jgi:N-acetylmuramoyl-L-alanine amidase
MIRYSENNKKPESMFRKYIPSITLITFLFTGILNLPAQTLKTIIVDAGHGGSDVGARGAYSTEKDISLTIALLVGQKLEKAFPDAKILYTRKSDTYPAIKERADFANKNNGDLFISIHVNAAPKLKHSKFIGYRTQTYYTGKGKNRKKRTRKVPKYNVTYSPNPSNGTETFIWAADRTQAKSEYVAERLADKIPSFDSVPDLDDPEFKVKSLLWTKKYFDKSLLLAELVEKEFVDGGRFSRGVKQRNEKGIWVLQATAMPSVLVETGFISSKAEEDYLNSKIGQEAIANSVVNAVKQYRTLTEGKSYEKIKVWAPVKDTTTKIIMDSLDIIEELPDSTQVKEGLK